MKIIELIAAVEALGLDLKPGYDGVWVEVNGINCYHEVGDSILEVYDLPFDVACVVGSSERAGNRQYTSEQLKKFAVDKIYEEAEQEIENALDREEILYGEELAKYSQKIETELEKRPDEDKYIRCYTIRSFDHFIELVCAIRDYEAKKLGKETNELEKVDKYIPLVQLYMLKTGQTELIVSGYRLEDYKNRVATNRAVLDTELRDALEQFDSVVHPYDTISLEETKKLFLNNDVFIDGTYDGIKFHDFVFCIKDKGQSKSKLKYTRLDESFNYEVRFDDNQYVSHRLGAMRLYEKGDFVTCYSRDKDELIEVVFNSNSNSDISSLSYNLTKNKVQVNFLEQHENSFVSPTSEHFDYIMEVLKSATEYAKKTVYDSEEKYNTKNQVKALIKKN